MITGHGRPRIVSGLARAYEASAPVTFFFASPWGDPGALALSRSFSVTCDGTRQISASMTEHDYAAGCTSPATAVAPAGCVSAKLSPWSSKSAPLVIRVVPQPKKKHK